jgi:hypothetical protein
VWRSSQIDQSEDRFLLNNMLEPTETTQKATIEPDELSDSVPPTDELDDELHDETTTKRGFVLPSLTLILALFLLTTSIGIALSAGFFLWSLSDHPVTPEASTSAQSE